MKTPAWLTEFHHRWQKARSRSVNSPTRPYGLPWTELLESAGIMDAEGHRTAIREAEKLESEERFILKRHRYRSYMIERIILPLEAEPWIRRHFGGESSPRLLERSLAVIERQPPHPFHPERWTELLARIRSSFLAGRTERPFAWRDPEGLDEILRLVRELTSNDWEPGTPVRAASVNLGLPSKRLERRHRSINRGLTMLFGKPASLADLGIVMSEAMLLIQGPLVLHLPDGKRKDFSGLAPYALSAADLQRALIANTPCPRLLTVENGKTTFRQLAAVNTGGQALLVASSFPTEALIALLQKLPPEVEHYHFGDSDPYGYLVLQKIRGISPRPVVPFHMGWRPAPAGEPLSAAEFRILDRMVESDDMSDCVDAIRDMRRSGNKGQFEQESLGPPGIDGWPFFE